MKLSSLMLDFKIWAYNFFKLYPKDGWEAIETDEDVQDLINALNSDPEVNVELRCDRCLKVWEPGHKCRGR